MIDNDRNFSTKKLLIDDIQYFFVNVGGNANYKYVMILRRQTFLERKSYFHLEVTFLCI